MVYNNTVAVFQIFLEWIRITLADPRGKTDRATLVAGRFSNAKVQNLNPRVRLSKFWNAACV